MRGFLILSQDVDVALAAPACPTGSTSASLRTASIELAHQRGLPIRGIAPISTSSSPADRSADEIPPPAELPSGHGAAWHLLHRSVSKAAAVQETPSVKPADGAEPVEGGSTLR